MGFGSAIIRALAGAIAQQNPQVTIMPPRRGPPTPAENCRRDSFNYANPDAELGDPYQIDAEKACLANERKKAYFGFVIGALGVINAAYAKPPLKRAEVSRFKNFENDTLTTAQPRIIQSNFETEPNGGISVFRPEILSILNFEPIYVGDPKEGDFSNEGRLIETQWQGAKIREESLAELQQSMQARGPQDEEEADNIYKAMSTNFQRIIQETQTLSDIFASSVNKREEVVNYLDIKKMWKERSPAPGLLPLKQFYQQNMGYTEEQFDSFSNTKIFIQLMSDFRQVCENYSFNLLDLTDADRAGDKSPINIDTTVTLDDGFSFTSAMMRSSGLPINAADRKNSDRFLISLPDDPADRLLVLINFLSKEYRISSAFGSNKNLVEKLSQDWGTSTQGTPFDNIIGVAGETIFDNPAGRNSLMNIAYENVVLPSQPGSEPGEMSVLPFEAKYIDTEDKTFVPGSDFFVDRFWDLVPGKDKQSPNFNLGPMAGYNARFLTRSGKARNMVLQLFLISQNGFPAKFDVQPDLIYSRVGHALRDATNAITPNNVNGKETESLQALTLAILKLSNTDRALKNMLFQYLLVMGILSNVENNPGSVWADLAVELGDISSLSGIKIPDNYKPSTSLLDGPKVLAPLLVQVVDRLHYLVRRRLLAGLRGTRRQQKRARRRPSLTRLAISQFRRRGKRAFSRLGIPLAAGISTDFIKNALLQIAKDTQYEKDSNIFREYVDTVAGLTDGISSDNNRTYLLDDGSGRTRFNFVSTSHQMLVIFEIFAAMAAKFAFCDFKVSGLDIQIDINTDFTTLVFNQVKAFDSSLFRNEPTTLGGFTRSIRAKLGTGDIEKFADRYTQEKALNYNHYGRRTLDINNATLTAVGQAVDNRPGGRIAASVRTLSRAQVDLAIALDAIMNKLNAENQIIVNFLWLIDEMAKDVASGYEKARRHFNKDLLKKALEAGTVEDFRTVKDLAQVRLGAYLNNDLNLRSINSFVNADIVLSQNDAHRNPIVSNGVSEEAKEALYSYLQEPEFQKSAQASTTMKIFSVGIPAEFVRNTQDRAKADDIDLSSFKRKEADVITVNIHKRDLRRPELIFKPQKFLFDMSLFQREIDIIQEIKPEPGQSHEKLLEKNQVIDYTFPAQKGRYKISGERAISKDAKYDFLSNAEQIDLLENHYQSFLLELYTKMATGMAIGEKTFTINAEPPNEIMDIGFEALLLSYFRDIQGDDIPAGSTVQELLDNPDVNISVKDKIRAMTSGQMLATPLTERDRVLKPKKFDRVFHVPVNIDDFEVDIPAMNSTAAGAQALRKASLQNSFRKQIVSWFPRRDDANQQVNPQQALFMKKRNDRDVIFEDFFVTLESTND